MTDTTQTPLDPRRELKKAGFASLLLRGVLGIVLGLLLVFAPLIGATFIATFLVIMIGVYGIVAAFRVRNS